MNKLDRAVWESRRWSLASSAMRGMLANPYWQKDQVADPKRLARCSVLYADALIAELKRKPK